MVPIHDTDVAAERWSKSEWENYELWEKVELRLKRQKRLWILGTVLVFLIFSAVPIVMDRWPKWVTRASSRLLAQEVNRIKREAIVGRSAYRLRFPDPARLTFVVEKVADCKAVMGNIVRTGVLLVPSSEGKYSLLGGAQGEELGIPGLVNELCYDPLSGSAKAADGEETSGFAIIPVNDLTERRMDRMTVLLLSGSSAEVSFD